MPAMEPMLAAGTAVAAGVVCRKFVPAINKDPRIDAAIKAAAGLGLIFASVKVSDGKAKAVMVGAGVGVIGCAAAQAIPALA